MYRNKSDFYIERAKNGVWYGFFLPFKQLGLKHGFSTRLGGVSEHSLGTLNMSFCVGDDEACARENRQRFCSALNISFDRLITVKQVHGTDIAVVGNKEAGMGAKEQKSAIHDADALVTSEKNIPLMLGFADCVPVILYAPHKQVVAVVHAGWKGTVGKIAAKVAEKICADYEIMPKEIFAGIGPSIGKCCYEVSGDVAEKFMLAFNDDRTVILEKEAEKMKLMENNKKRILDLWRANVVQLLDTGILEKNIFISNVCTNCNSELFFSHRASRGSAGRMGVIVSL